MLKGTWGQKCKVIVHIFEEVIIMKNVLKNLEVCMGKTAYQVTKKNVNSACMWTIYQPKLPETAKKLHK